MKLPTSACLILLSVISTDAFQGPHKRPSTVLTGPLPAATTFVSQIRTNNNDDDSGDANLGGMQSDIHAQQMQHAVHIPSVAPQDTASGQVSEQELTQQQRRRQQRRRRQNTERRGYQQADDDKGRSVNLLDEFTTANGDLVDPYKILKVARDADRQQVRQAYVTLSKRYHPDGARNMKILPGNCNNLDEVRDQWERIKLSYEILRDSKTRKRYDRHVAIADPGAALQRATLNAMGKGVIGLGKGLFNVGAMAVTTIATAVTTETDQNVVQDKQTEKKPPMEQ